MNTKDILLDKLQLAHAQQVRQSSLQRFAIFALVDGCSISRGKSLLLALKRVVNRYPAQHRQVRIRPP